MNMQLNSRRIVIKVGGSLLFDKNLNIQTQKVMKFANIIKESDSVVGIVVGGGKIARIYIQAVRDFRVNESICDTLGIELSRINARLLIAALGSTAFPEPIVDLIEARKYSLFNKILISGGFIPGQSTTSVTFELAESIHATDVIILTDVDGIYEKDPKKYPSAKKYNSITTNELEKILFSNGDIHQASAGEYRILDAVSLQIFKRSTFTVLITNGEKVDQLQSLLNKQKFEEGIGTQIIRSSK